MCLPLQLRLQLAALQEERRRIADAGQKTEAQLATTQTEV